MNMAEAADLRVLKARVETLEKKIADIERRFDDFSKADRARQQERETLKVNKAS